MRFYSRLLLAAFIFLFISSSSHAFNQYASADRLVVNVPFNTPKSSKIFMTGDFCDWKVRCVQLLRLNEFSFGTGLSSAMRSSSFKISRGSWESEAANSWGEALPNLHWHSFRQEVGSVILDVVNWKDLGELKTVGTFVEIDSLDSPQLDNARPMSVWLPPGYDEETNRRYPVIYMHDGQNVFDPRKASFGVDWSVDDVLTQMIYSGAATPTIVVGVHHKVRGREYNDEDLGRLYSRFLVETVKPYIDENFRTRPDRRHTLLMGSSFGGVISLTTLFRYPYVFSKAAALSIKSHGFRSMLDRFLTRVNPPQNVSLYMDNGDSGIDSSYVTPNRQFASTLRSYGFTNFVHREFSYADHNETAWARRLHIPLTFLLEDLRPVEQLPDACFDRIDP